MAGIKGAYWPTWVADTNPPSSIPSNLFTHLFYAFLQPDNATFRLSLTETDHQWMEKFTAAAHSQTPPAKALLSIGGASANNDTFALMASNPVNRAAFIQSTIEVARKYGFDGLDLDWEFPSDSKQMSDFGTLLAEWRAATDNEFVGIPLLLSAAVFFSPTITWGVNTTFPCDAIEKYLDFVNPMTYDYIPPEDTSKTGAHALLNDNTSDRSTRGGITSWIGNGVSPKKLVMGLPLYGKTWVLEDPDNHGIGAPATGRGIGWEGAMSYSEIVDFNLANNATVVFDGQTVSVYSYKDTDWIGYDDAESIAAKVTFAKELELGGYFLWAIGQDRNWEIATAASEAWN